MPFATTSGCRIHYDELGDRGGPPLVLVRGLGRSRRYWRPIVPELAAFRLIALDNRGVGKSDAPRPPYRVRQLADDVAAVMDAARIDQAHAFGISLGGMIAQELALSHPARVKRLVLGCTTPGRRGVQPAMRAQLELVRGARDVDRQLRFLLSAATVREQPALRDEWRAIAAEEPVALRGFIGQVTAALRFDALDRLGAIGQPTLVITGDDDKSIPPGNSELLAARIPHAKLVVLRGAGHDFTTDRPAEAGRAIREFLT